MTSSSGTNSGQPLPSSRDPLPNNQSAPLILPNSPSKLTPSTPHPPPAVITPSPVMGMGGGGGGPQPPTATVPPTLLPANQLPAQVSVHFVGAFNKVGKSIF